MGTCPKELAGNPLAAQRAADPPALRRRDADRSGGALRREQIGALEGRAQRRTVEYGGYACSRDDPGTVRPGRFGNGPGAGGPPSGRQPQRPAEPGGQGLDSRSLRYRAESHRSAERGRKGLPRRTPCRRFERPSASSSATARRKCSTPAGRPVRRPALRRSRCASANRRQAAPVYSDSLDRRRRGSRSRGRS